MFCSVSAVCITLADCLTNVCHQSQGRGSHVIGCLRKSVAVPVIFVFKELYMSVQNSSITWAASLEESALLVMRS